MDPSISLPFMSSNLFNRLEFEDHHLGKFVTSTCRDVLSEGFGLKNVADAGKKLCYSVIQRHIFTNM